tara:strand:- start:421 stop:609 length:189 start_codon:yes stop_codon:yes gene_type:complete
MMSELRSKFLKVRCNDCPEEKIIFDRAATTINCTQCESTLVIPKGGRAELANCAIIEVLEQA